MLINTKELLRKLSSKDLKEIKNAFNSQDFIVFPRLGSDSRILPSQWKSWQVCQRMGIGFIKGDFDSCEFKLSELGKELAKDLK